MESLSEPVAGVWQCISSSVLWHYISANWPAGFGIVAAAWLAFLFGRKQQKDLAGDADVVAGYQARFALRSQKETMSNIWEEYLRPLQGDPKRHRKLQRYPLLAEYPTVPFDRLGYFLKDREGEDILGETRRAQNVFFKFVRLLDQRNPRYDEMQRLMVQGDALHRLMKRQAGLIEQQGDDYKNIALVEALVKVDTDFLYELAPDVLDRLGASTKKIDEYLKKRFPKYRTLGLDER